jgi:D-sedoheptulose 7-phosphate isomerase
VTTFRSISWPESAKEIIAQRSADPAALTALANRAAFDSAYAEQVDLLGMPADIAVGISADGNCIKVIQVLQAARTRGLVTVTQCGPRVEQLRQNAVGESAQITRPEDPLPVKELHMTTYHILREPVHVFFEQFLEHC